MKKAVITLFLWAFFPVVQANVSQDLDNFFNGMGYASNVTSPMPLNLKLQDFLVGVHSMLVIRYVSISWCNWICPVTVLDVEALIYILAV
ncbi:hypothetical protein PGH45_20140 [Legionella pneumophila]|nr:hypothetical protein [Legionella pneumophila]